MATLNEKLYESPPIGLETGDKALNQTALVLRLLHIDELRQLQEGLEISHVCFLKKSLGFKKFFSKNIISRIVA